MPTESQDHRYVVVIVEGGVVQDIICNDPSILITLLDWDSVKDGDLDHINEAITGLLRADPGSFTEEIFSLLRYYQQHTQSREDT